MFIPIVLAALVGHVALCIMFINRLHSTGLPHFVVKSIDILWYLFFFGGLLWLSVGGGNWSSAPSIGKAYIIACHVGVLLAVVAWVRRMRHRFECDLLTSTASTNIDIVKQLGHCPIGQLKAKLASHFPTNQILQLEVNEKTLHLPRLDSRLDGLSIVHLSDLHLTGQMLPSFYEEVVRQALALDGDLIAITGDIIDKKFCRPWIDDLLRPLQAKHGVFFVLGNHDERIHDEHGFRQQLAGLGLTDLGNGHWSEISLGGQRIILAGSELPWFKPGPDCSTWPQAEAANQRHLRILLSHSPDQIGWARKADVDLVLAGHTHGGQIRLPSIGPVFSPSRFGGEYASGTFYCEPTVMHVSRGISGTRPLRLRCAPELTKLTLRSGWPA